MNMTKHVHNNDNLEVVFSEIGEFNLFQILTLILLSLMNILAAGGDLSYMFIGSELEYRLAFKFQCNLHKKYSIFIIIQ